MEHIMASFLGRLAAISAVVGGGTVGTGVYIHDKIDELENYTNSKWENLRNFSTSTLKTVQGGMEMAEAARLQAKLSLARQREMLKAQLDRLDDDNSSRFNVLLPTSFDTNSLILQDSISKTKIDNFEIPKVFHQEVENVDPPPDVTTPDSSDVPTPPPSPPPDKDKNDPTEPDEKTKSLIKQLENSHNLLENKAKQILDLECRLKDVNLEKSELQNTITSTEIKYFDSCKRIEQLEKEAYDLELKYQKAIGRLEQDLIDLRRQVLYEREKRKLRNERLKSNIKRQLVDIYSEVLDTLSTCGYSSADQLPRIIVIGDQSAGKTSVLEAIAKARLFPRGAGKMMTKTPIKVTLSEGPRMEAYFPDSPEQIYNLSKPKEEAALRNEIEIRMNKSCDRIGSTVSEIPVSLTVSGPGIRRMVLVDLPGMINTVTSGMHENTKRDIESMAKHYMSNPNSIILCIQDGSVDAERSIVTQLVSDIDPKGSRTIFVLTKVDKAEAQGCDSNRIKKILDGKLFPMKALGYHAVVTGRGESYGDDTIDNIKEYEEHFFQDSQLFRSGLLKPSQLTTANLSTTVSELFWKMIKETIEQQSDAFKAAKFNLETEWKNNFPRIRELDRFELFEKAKNEILDKVLELPSTVQPKEWENELLSRLWEQAQHHVVEHIFLPSAIKADNSASFNTMLDIKLKQWTDRMLPKLATSVAKEMLLERFSGVLVPSKNEDKTKIDVNVHDRRELNFDIPSSDPIFDLLREDVLNESISRHKWDEEYYKTLRVIQLNALEDRVVPNHKEWKDAIKFIEENLGKRLQQTDAKLEEMCGNSTVSRWMKWSYNTEEQSRNRAISEQLLPLMKNRNCVDSPNILTEEETLTIRKSLEMNRPDIKLPNSNVECHKVIRAMWYQLYRKHFLSGTIKHCQSVLRQFSTYKIEHDPSIKRNLNMPNYYQKNEDTKQNKSSHFGYDEIVLFWRIMKMLDASSNALRQQMMNNEAKRLEKHVNNVLEDIGNDSDKLAKLLIGRRVTLAEELKKVREIQSLLDEFINELRREV